MVNVHHVVNQRIGRMVEEPSPSVGGAPQPGGEVVVVRDLETLRVLSDPLRLRMVELMSAGEWTVKQVAAELGVGPTRLYRHVAILEGHGLLRMCGTRLVSGIVEKRYTAPSRVTVDSALFAPGGDAPADVAAAVDGLVSTAFATVRREIGAAIQAGRIEVSPDHDPGRGLMLTLDDAALTETQAREFRARLEALLAEFAALSGPRPAEGGEGSEARTRYRLLAGLYAAAGENPGGTR
jgi:DNA-binding transcriptional ArsR family regulator